MPHRFFRDEQFDFEIKIALGGVYYGCGDVGEILATAENIRDGHDDSWAAEWIGLATRVRSIAETCARDGRRVSAREAFLRAASYYANSFNVTLRNAKLDDDLLSNFQRTGSASTSSATSRTLPSTGWKSPTRGRRCPRT